jgi:asparagine synthase (glutamine-hydrolysing)
MCGICGLFDPAGGLRGEPAESAVAAMMAAIARRGPDDQGSFADPSGTARLGFRRLSILDLSAAGHQPMLSRSGRSAIVFNGEIFNFPELRAGLESSGFELRSRADSEVLLELLERDGLAVLPRLRGMFAFAFYEIPERRLTLARDPFGIKPLHLRELPGGRLAFASQLDALMLGGKNLNSPGELDPASLGLYLRLSHLPPPYGFYRGTSQLPPGSYLRRDAAGKVESGAYFSFAQPESFERHSRAELLDRFESLLGRATRRHRLSDVPLGVFLSGGVDSPLVAAHAAEQARAEGLPMPAFILANPGWGQDEGPAARAYGEALGLAPRVVDFGPAATLAALDDLIAAQTEPFADFSLLPALLLSRLARHEVKVVLSGDGGDELFFGYERPLSLLRDGGAFAWPRPVRRWLYAAGRLGLARRRSDAILFPTPGDYYLAVNCRFPENELRAVAPSLPGLPADFAIYRGEETGDWRSLLRFARRAEIAGQLQRGLKKLDMASMFHGLEARVPLLDLELAALAGSIDPLAHLTPEDGPAGELLRKSLLRGLLARKVPAALLPGRKLGFSVPLAELLRTTLRPRAEAALFGSDLLPAGLFDRGRVAALWQAHQEGLTDAKWALWAILSLQLYLRKAAS